jgi:hypothetical protein
MNLTLVAYYGPKQQGKVRELIETTQSLLRDQLKTAFDGYVLEQVHGTIIGLEGVRVDDVVMNANFLRRRQLQKAFHLETAIELALGVRGFDVRIGGFKDRDAYPFTSRGLHPYLRSFSIQGEIAVAMGWPVEGTQFPLYLDEFRRSFTAANALHAYHAAPEDIDNDFYFVLGRLKQSQANELTLQLAQDRMRDALAALEPVAVRIDKDCLRIVAYSHTLLPWGDCEMFTLDGAAGKVAYLESLYDPLPTE